MLGARNSSWFIKDPQSLLHSVKKTVLKSNFHYVYQDVFCLIFVTKIGASNSLIELRKIFKYLSVVIERESLENKIWGG